MKFVRNILLLLWMVLAIWSAQAGEHLFSVLMLYPDSFYSKMTLEFDEAFCTALQEKYMGKVKFEVLILTPENRGANIGKLVQAQSTLVEINCRLHQSDLIFVMTPELVSRVTALPDKLLQRAKVLVMGLTMEDQFDLPSNFYTVRYKFDGKPDIDLACQMQPNLEQMAVIGGVSEFDQRLYKMYYNTIGDNYRGIDISYWTNFSMAEVELRVSNLPDTTSVYFLSLFCDRDGNRYTTMEAASQIIAASRVPVYTSVGTLLESGIIGGFMFCHKKLGLYAADLVMEIWSDKEVDRHVTMQVSDISTACLDYQAIKRWGVEAHNVPKEALVINKPASLWQGHRHWVIGTLMAIGFLSIFIMVLLVQHQRVSKTKNLLHQESRQLEITQAQLRLLTKVVIEADEQEHHFIARELHDDISQRIAALALELANLEQRLDACGCADMGDEIRVLREKHVELAHSLHGLSRRLHPTCVTELGLKAALKSVIEGMERDYTMEIGFYCDLENDNFSAPVALTVFRVVQQALTNVSKHAQVKKAKVFLRLVAGELDLVIEDEGIGFDTEASSGGGIGLISMRERVLSQGGTWDIFSAPDAGTSIRVSIPVG